MNKISPLLLLIACLLAISACKNDPKPAPPPPKPPKPQVNIPKFNVDNAYNFVDKQVAFGPRFMNTKAHDDCAKWMAEKLSAFGATVIEQKATLKAYNGKDLKATNIIASFNVPQKNRILLCAHWDTRHIADYDPDPSKRDQPILGADDGASGVGVLMEVARILGENGMKDVGVDIVLFDAEDYGQPRDGGGFPQMRDSYALGSQYWARTPHKPGYRAKFGILLDMVGAENARFTMDGTSMKYAPHIMNKVWDVAHKSGYGRYFSYEKSGELQDDHLYVNTIAKIPTIDIINRQPGDKFGEHWHTLSDNMDVINKTTLNAVGQTVLNVVYQESIN